MTNEFDALIDLFENLIFDAQGEMYMHINFKPEDLRVSCPEFITELFFRALQHKYMASLGTVQHAKDFVYKGLKFIPSYELEIAVWHKDYPLYKKEWMLRKIPLQTPFVVHNGVYDKYIIPLTSLLGRYAPIEIFKMN